MGARRKHQEKAARKNRLLARAVYSNNGIT